MLEIAWVIHTLFFATVCVVGHMLYPRPAYHPSVAYELFHLIAFVVRPYLVIFLDAEVAFRYMRISPTDFDILHGLLIADFSLIVFVTVSIMATRRDAGPRYPGLPKLDEVNRTGIVVAALLLAPLALYSAMVASGGFGMAYDDGTWTGAAAAVQMRMNADGGMVYENTTGYIALAHSLLGSVTVLLIVVNRFRWWSYIPFCVYIVFRVFLGWQRWGIVLPLATLFLLVLFRRQGRGIPVHWIVAGLVVMVGFNIIGTNRDMIRDFFETGQLIVSDSGKTVLERLDTLDIASFDFMIYIMMAVPKLSGTWSYFSQHLDVLTMPIPRVLWPDKPVGSPIQLVNLNQMGFFIGLTRGLTGDGWMSLGWVGVAVNCSLAAYFLTKAYNLFRKRLHQPPVFYGYLLLLPIVAQVFRDGSLSALLLFLLWIGLPVALWRVLVLVIRQVAGARSVPASS